VPAVPPTPAPWPVCPVCVPVVCVVEWVPVVSACLASFGWVTLWTTSLTFSMLIEVVVFVLCWVNEVESVVESVVEAEVGSLSG
jgi:hypothetical protein